MHQTGNSFGGFFASSTSDSPITELKLYTTCWLLNWQILTYTIRWNFNFMLIIMYNFRGEQFSVPRAQDPANQWFTIISSMQIGRFWFYILFRFKDFLKLWRKQIYFFIWSQLLESAEQNWSVTTIYIVLTLKSNEPFFIVVFIPASNKILQDLFGIGSMTSQ